MFSQKSVRRFVGDSSAFVMGAMFLASALNKGIHPPGNSKKCLLIPGEMLLFRALAKKMVPMTNADESPTNRLMLFPIYLSLFIVSTLCLHSLQHRHPNLVLVYNFMYYGGGGVNIDVYFVLTDCKNN